MDADAGVALNLRNHAGRLSVRARFGRMLGRATRAIAGLLAAGRKRPGTRLMRASGTRPQPWHNLGRAQWCRWHKENARNRRQLRAWKQRSGRRIDPRKADLPRWSVP